MPVIPKPKKPNFLNKLMGLSAVERFWAQVTKEGPIHPKCGRCWVKLGVGEWYINVNKKLVRANRFSWELHNGPIPSGLCVLHHCDNPACIRPSHLFLGTNKDNSEDMVAKGRAKGGVSGPNNSSTKYPELRQGDNNGNRKLSSNQVISMRRDRKLYKLTYKQLSAKYGVSIITVNRVVNNKVWKHI